MAYPTQIAVAIISCFLVFSSSSLHGAEISTTAPEGCALNLTGDIEPGDADALWAILQDPDFYAPDRSFICLDSNGGSLSEAFKLADMISTRYLGTFVPEQAACLAECAIIFMFGQGSGEHWVGTNRKIHHSATLGFRRPSFSVPADQEYTAEQVQVHHAAAYENIMILLNTLVQQDTHNFPISLMSNMLGHVGDSLYLIDTPHKALWWEIDVAGWTPPREITPQIATLACQIVADTILDGDGAYAPFADDLFSADLLGPKSIYGETTYLSLAGWLWEGSFSCRVGHAPDSGSVSVCFGQYETLEDEDYSAMCRNSPLLAVDPNMTLANLP